MICDIEYSTYIVFECGHLNLTSFCVLLLNGTGISLLVVHWALHCNALLCSTVVLLLW